MPFRDPPDGSCLSASRPVRAPVPGGMPRAGRIARPGMTTRKLGTAVALVAVTDAPSRTARLVPA
ncbi:hypothetical protein [Falsiroseomonas oryzae]|uniref:hypothetical protein n=1 Tax=Falsiroseomonas oryzae TaxID=2766473 RepID=UPI0022EB261A|nr:hypothetical protein [Roseomonas sp. MO-31]